MSGRSKEFVKFGPGDKAEGRMEGGKHGFIQKPECPNSGQF